MKDVAFIKVVITGAFNAGKTRFIRSASDTPPVLTEELTFGGESAIKRSTTVALDYGKAVLDSGVHVYMFGTPGQERFSFMRDLLARGMDAYIVLVDSTDREALPKGRAIVEGFAALPSTPYVIAASRADLSDALGAEELRRLLGVAAEVPIVPCNAQQRASVHSVLATLLELPGVRVRS
jgi:signal recognition particle receptor subunit beta